MHNEDEFFQEKDKIFQETLASNDVRQLGGAWTETPC